MSTFWAYYLAWVAIGLVAGTAVAIRLRHEGAEDEEIAFAAPLAGAFWPVLLLMLLMAALGYGVKRLLRYNG